MGGGEGTKVEAQVGTESRGDGGLYTDPPKNDLETQGGTPLSLPLCKPLALLLYCVEWLVIELCIFTTKRLRLRYGKICYVVCV